MNKFEAQFDPKECKHYIDAYDVIFVDDQHELRFCRYCKPIAANVSGKYHMVAKDNNQTFDYITRDRALCFYDIDHHRWCSKIDYHRYKCWEVMHPDDDIFINTLVGIAIDEIFGSKTCLSVDDITHRIKIRFGIWYDKYVDERRNTIKIPDSVRIPQTRNNGERFNIRNSKPNHTIYQLPQPKMLQFNDIFTTVVWDDGSHTVIKLREGDGHDEEKAILYATIKRMKKNNGCATQRYLGQFYNNVQDVNRRREKHDKKDNSEDNN